ncbi:MAG: diguanylate cyclase/phosphodiesterase with sensor(s) [Frankiales bacterium]|nr:diguanylate cyclase/phosphodiesterase with sensor(s) [Frankiales bacterium]
MPDFPSGAVLAVPSSIGSRDHDLRRAARLRAMVEQSADTAWTADESGTVTSTTVGLLEPLGWNVNDVVGQLVFWFIHPDDLPRFQATWDRVVSGDVPHETVECRVRQADGDWRWVRETLHDLRHDPDVGGIAGWARDISDSHRDAERHEAELRADYASRLRELEMRSQQQQEFFDALSARTNELALVLNAQGELLYVSAAIRHLLGYNAEDLLSQECWGFVHPDDLPAGRAVFEAVLTSGGSRSIVCRARDAEGGWRWVEATSTNLMATSVGGIVCNLHDVTDRVEAEQALRESEARYRAIADTAAEGILTVSPTGVVLYANDRLGEIIGVATAELVGRSFFELIHESPARQFRSALATRSEQGTERYEVEFPHPDGRIRWLSVAATPLRDEHGAFQASLAMVSDITDARRNEEDLRRVALYDVLTGLPNRALLLDRLGHALARDTGQTAVLLVNLDRFKLINDTRGHAIADEVLVAAAQRLSAAVRPSDTVARYSGDEFVILAEDVELAEATALAHDLLAALRTPIELAAGTLEITASVGVAVGRPAHAEDLLRNADRAMQTAKSAGRGRVRQFDRDAADELEVGYALVADLRRALASDELDLAYQPVIDLGSGAVLGIEALARWSHPVHGDVPPARFVAMAERNGLAPELDRWVVRRALSDARDLRADGSLPPGAYVAINLSARSLVDNALEAFVATSAAEAGVPAEHIVLEITEGVIMEDAATAIDLLQRLRALGFRIAIDDFGTGYSSLAYLRDLPINILKIDRSFVSGITTDRDALAIAASIVDLARAVGVSVVAEGIETSEQAALLRQLGCGSGQGWLWCRALSPSEVRSTVDWTQPCAPLPGPAATPTAQRRGEVRREHGIDRLMSMHGDGASLATIASALNRDGYRTPQGQRWHSATVARAIARSAYPALDDRA